MKKTIIFLLSSLALTLCLSAEFYRDITIFKSEKNLYQIICDIEVPSSSITYKALDGKLTGLIQFKALVRNIKTNQTATDEWNTKSMISKNEEISQNMSLFDRTSFVLSPGQYEFSIIVFDSLSAKSYSTIDTFSIDSTPSSPFMSDILIALTVNKDTLNGKFSKNGYEIIPNPSNKFSLTNPILYLYTEIYNIPKDKEYSINYNIRDINDSLISNIEGARKKAPGFDFVNTQGISTLAFKEGSYILELVLSFDNEKISKRTLFEKTINMKTNEQKKYVLTEEQLKYYGMIEYIATEQEKTQYASLDDKAKHNFLLNFWERRDANKTNSKLEILDEYIKKIKYVNGKYSSGFEEGYKSARGRIYLTYGEPDETLIIPMSKGAKSYDNWLYYRNGGMQFIFMDIKGFGKFELLYTNMNNEVIPQNYDSYIDDENMIQFNRD